ETDENMRLDDCELGVEPRAARGDLRPVWLLVDAALSARLPLEVLDHVRDVGERAVDACVCERLVQESSGRPDERGAGPVFLVAGLLADEHDLGLRRAFSEDRLRARLPERAGLAAGGCLRQLLERGARGDERW